MLVVFILSMWTASADTPIAALVPAQQEIFTLAETAWEQGDLAGAEQGYQAITAQTPSFDRAWRRQCGVVLAQGRVEEARTLCEQAVSLKRSEENLTGLAIALTSPISNAQQAERDALQRASEMLDEALQQAPDYLPAWQALCSWAMEASDHAALKRGVEHLESTIPGEVGTLYFRAVLDLELGELEHAITTLQAAQARGLPNHLYQPLALRLQTERSPAPANQVGRIRTVPNIKAERVWSWADMIPIGIAALLVLVVFMVAFLGGQDDDES